MKPTVREIAKQAGVSIASVSLVLNNKPSRITEATKQRILQAADDLGYVFEEKQEKPVVRPHVEDRVIGVVYPKRSDFFLDRCLCGIERYANLHGYQVLTCLSEDSTSRAIDAIGLFARMGVDGIILIPPVDMNENKNNERLGAALQGAKLPFLLLNEAIDRVYCDFITADHKGGAYMATDYLIHHGHRNTGMIAGRREVYSCRKRVEGYKEALAFYDIAIRDKNVYYGDYCQRTGYEGMKYFDRLGVRAIFVCGKELAAGVYQYAGEHQLKIGEDISLVGFCDVPTDSLWMPGLTSIGQPGEMMGKKSCEILINRITGECKGPIGNSYFSTFLREQASVKQIN